MAGLSRLSRNRFLLSVQRGTSTLPGLAVSTRWGWNQGVLNIRYNHSAVVQRSTTRVEKILLDTIKVGRPLFSAELFELQIGYEGIGPNIFRNLHENVSISPHRGLLHDT